MKNLAYVALGIFIMFCLGQITTDRTVNDAMTECPTPSEEIHLLGSTTESETEAELSESLTDNGETPPSPIMPTAYNGVPVVMIELPYTL